MKIAYLIPESLTAHPGLHYKINEQVKCWSDAGSRVYLVCLSERVVIEAGGTVVFERLRISKERRGRFSILKELALDYEFVCEALRFINPNITYSRYLFPARSVAKISEYAGKLIVEINSNDCAEFFHKSYLTGAYNFLCRGIFLRSADAFVFVTHELSRAGSFRQFSSQRVVIANGISADDFPFSDVTNNENPNLVFIGSPGQKWHGLDKILLLAERLSTCTFHIIGPSEKYCIEEWGYKPSNLVCHGYLSSENAAHLIRQMDIGIGTLALHRKNMEEACPLKVRQYLAQGLPVLAGNNDTDIVEEKSFYLKISNNEENIKNDFGIIESFVYRVFNNKVYRREARSFAVKALSPAIKESARLNFFTKVIKS